jgi:hypothetical protein
MNQWFINSARMAAVLAIGLGVVGIRPAFADDDNDRKQNNNADEPSGSQDASHTNGQVIRINTLTDPQEIVLANIDGQVVVKMSGKDAKNLIKENGVRLGEYIEVWGQKQSELEFWADSINPVDEDK